MSEGIVPKGRLSLDWGRIEEGLSRNPGLVVRVVGISMPDGRLHYRGTVLTGANPLTGKDATGVLLELAGNAEAVVWRVAGAIEGWESGEVEPVAIEDVTMSDEEEANNNVEEDVNDDANVVVVATYGSASTDATPGDAIESDVNDEAAR